MHIWNIKINEKTLTLVNMARGRPALSMDMLVGETIGTTSNVLTAEISIVSRCLLAATVGGLLLSL